MFQSILPGGQFEGCRLGIFDQLAVVPWFCPGASEVECGFATSAPKMTQTLKEDLLAREQVGDSLISHRLRPEDVLKSETQG
jgi:hypothetical protein